MSIDGIETIKKHVRILDAIRLNKGLDKSGVAQLVGMTWPTISGYVESLISENVIYKDTSENNILRVNKDYGIFFGISVGSAQVKVCAIDMDFQMLRHKDYMELLFENSIFKELRDYMEAKAREDAEKNGQKVQEPIVDNYVWIETPDDRQKLIDTINHIFESIKKIVENQTKYQVLGIGVAITGAIDQKEKRIIKSFNLTDMDETDFEEDVLLRNYLDFFEMKGINIAIENNSMAAGIAEKWSFYDEYTLKGEYNINQKYKDCKNIATIYLGAGFGLGMIQDNKVYRGSNNLCGGVGHLEVPNYRKTLWEEQQKELVKKKIEEVKEEIITVEKKDLFLDYRIKDGLDKKCTCGGCNCLDYRVRTDVFEQSFKDFKKSNSNDIKELFTLDEIQETDDKTKKGEIERSNENKKEKILLMGKYLGYVINLLNNILNPDVIVISGKAYLAMDELWGAIQLKKSENNLKYTNNNCAIIKSQLGPLAPAIGAAICAYYDKYEANIEW